MPADLGSWRLRAVDRIAHLPATLLGGLPRPSAYADVREYRSTESGLFRATYLALIDVHDAPVAFVPVYRVDKAPTSGYDPAVLFDLPPREGLLLFGSVRNFANHLTFAATRSPAERVRAAALLVARAMEIADRDGLDRVLAPCLNPEQAAVLESLDDAWRRSRHVDPQAVVDIGWPDFERYRRSLSRNGRKLVRRERDAFAPLRAGLAEHSLGAVIDVATPLVAQVERKYGQRLSEPQVRWYLHTLNRQLGELGTALVLTVGAAPVAVSVLWCHPDGWHVLAWGCDYARASGAALYGNLVFYEPIERAIAAGAPAVRLGGTALEAKRRRGARLEDSTSILLRAGQDDAGASSIDTNASSSR